MTVKNPKCLVVDASVLRAAKKANAIHPVPIMCRDFLDEIFKSGHKVIMTPEIKVEWDKHIRSNFAKDWYFNMLKRGRLLVVQKNVIDDNLRQLILDITAPDVINAVTKDMRLIEAALQADEIISSLDDKMRGHFKRAALKIDEIQSVVWINPINADEDCIIWLRQSCPPDDFRLLSYQD
ncbi:MAG: hypothetical protein WBC91_14875 [Phototrophicaceae bacterium]